MNRDAACSFFAIQSGVLPWSPDPGHGLWSRNTAHASLALYSAVLKYRVPAPILHYMRERPAEYRAEIRSAYADGRGGHRDLLRLAQPPAHRRRPVREL